MDFKPTEKRGALAIAVVWCGFSIPLSEIIFDEVVGGDFLTRVFVWWIVSASAWVPFGWKWVIGGELFSKKFVFILLVLHACAVLAFFSDRYLDDHAYIPILASLVFCAEVFAFDRFAWFRQTGLRSTKTVEAREEPKKKELFSEASMKETRQRLRKILEYNLDFALKQSDDLITDTGLLLTGLYPEMLSHKHLSAMDEIGLRSEMIEHQRDKVATEYAFVCAVHVFGRVYDDFQASDLYQELKTHFLSKEPVDPHPALPDEDQSYITERELPKLLTLAEKFEEAKHPNVQAGITLAVIMKTHGFPSPFDDDDHRKKVGNFGVMSLNRLREVYKTLEQLKEMIGSKQPTERG